MLSQTNRLQTVIRRPRKRAHSIDESPISANLANEPNKKKKMKKLWLDTDLNANTVQEMILTTRTNKKPTNIYKGFAFAKRKRTNLKER